MGSPLLSAMEGFTPASARPSFLHVPDSLPTRKPIRGESAIVRTASATYYLPTLTKVTVDFGANRCRERDVHYDAPVRPVREEV